MALALTKGSMVERAMSNPNNSMNGAVLVTLDDCQGRPSRKKREGEGGREVEMLHRRRGGRGASFPEQSSSPGANLRR